MANPIRVGVVGAHAERGWGRWTHLPALQGLPDDYEVVAVASTGQAQAEDAAKVWGAPVALGSAQELFAHPDVELVTIAVQLTSRAGLVEGALDAGKHVYSEWPLALDAATAAGFRDRAASSGLRTAIGLQSRYHPAIRYAGDLVRQGELGELLSASLGYSLSTPGTWSQRYAALFDKTRGVNHLAVVCGHSIDMVRSAVGDVAELSGTLVTRIPTVTIEETGDPLEVTSPDQIVVSGSLEGGAAFSVNVTTGPGKGDGFRIEIHGTAGRLVLVSKDDSLVGPVFDVYRGSGAGDLEAVAVPDAYRLAGEDGPPVANVREVYRSLAAGIRSGAEVTPDFTTATSMHRILDAIRASSDEGVRVTL